MRLINLVFSVIGLFLAVFLFGCQEKDNGYDIPPADGRVVGSIHGIVQDNFTNERIAGAVVQYVVSGKFKTVTTDSLGYYFISGLGTGEYELTVFADGNYAKGKTVVSVPSIEEVAGPNPSLKNYSVSLVEDIFLYKLNAGITGSLYAQDSFGNMQPVANATIIVRFSDSGIEPAVYSTVTDNDGNYLFDKSLPAYNNYYTVLYSLPFTLDGIDYNAASISNINLTPDINIKASNLVATISTSNVVLISSPFNQIDFNPAANFQFVFSKSVDVSTVNIQLRRDDYYGTIVYFDEAWSANNTTLVMNPYALLRDNTQYYISVDGKTIDNSSFNFNGYVTTSGEEQGITMIHTNLETVEGSYTDSFPVDGNIDLLFSTSVDTSISTFSLNENSYPYSNVPCEISVSADLKTITLNPVDSLNYNFNYSLFYYAYSLTGYSTSYTINFKTENQ